MIKTFPKGCRVRIIPLYGKQRVDHWYAAQKDKPLAVLNASLYSWKGVKQVPAGIVFEGGREPVNGAGNALGLGYQPGGDWQFAKAYDAVWEQFLSGYVLVQNSTIEPVPVTFYGDDRNLHLNRHQRLAIGQSANGLMIVGSDTAQDMMAFKIYCHAQGMITGINLDGGGSRHFICNGQTIYGSDRYPYNIIAIYPPDGGDYEPEEMTAMKITCTAKTSVYDSNGKLESGRYITKGDICTLDAAILPALLIGIAYPTASGMRKAYIKSLGGFKPC